jgi:metallo-beta-lactamase family protein
MPGTACRPCFSAHADQNGLLDRVSHLAKKPERLFVVHGEAKASDALNSLVAQRFGIATVVPRAGEQYLLTPHGLELAKAPLPAVRPAGLDTRQQLLLEIFRLEKTLAEVKEDLVLMDNGDTETDALKQMVPELGKRIDALLQIVPKKP